MPALWYWSVVMRIGLSSGMAARKRMRAALRMLVVVWRAWGSMKTAEAGMPKSLMRTRRISMASFQGV